MENEASKGRDVADRERCLSHPVVRIFSDPRVKRYFEESKRELLEFGDIQYLLCRRKPKKTKWAQRWKRYFPLRDGLTGKERYNSKEHVHQELTRLRRRFPGLIERFDGSYALSPPVRNNAMKDFILSRLEDHPHILIFGDRMYFGLDSTSFDEEDAEFFDTHVRRLSMKIASEKEIVKSFWLRLELKGFLNEFERVLHEVPDKDKGLFIGYAYEDAKWFLRSCEANLEDFQEFFERLETSGTTYGREVWNEAEAYIRNVPEILSEHRKELEKHVQDEFQRSTATRDRFKIVSRALKNMIDGHLISKKEHKWLRVQQRMSRLYSKKLRKRLRSRTSERLPLIVIDTSRPYFPDKA